MNNGNKDLELKLEKEKLKYTTDVISEEILNFIEYRKSLTNEIINYRKKFIEEYRDDEDAIVEYFDHERYVQEEAFRKVDKKLKELNVLKYSPYFGSVTFNDEGFEEEEKYYIGRFGVTPDGYAEPLIVDWRAPVAALFYSGTLGKYSYKAPKGDIEVDLKERRQYIIKKGQLLGMFDSAIDVKDEILQMVLSKNSNDKLKDIVMTIQKEQDEIIRQPRFSTTIVNGVAGSGKTTIALHRVAYLLYNYRKQLEDKLLILGPNSIFMEYISDVLPSLGENGSVKQKTFREFALEYINKDINLAPFNYEIEAVMNKDINLIDELKYKGSNKFVDDLNCLINDMECNYFNIQDLIFDKEILISKDEIEKMLNVDYKYMPLFRRALKIKRILYNKIRYKRDDKFRIIEKKYSDKKASMDSRQLVMEENNLEFSRKLEIRELIREVLNAKNSLNYLEGEMIEDIYYKNNKSNYMVNDDLAAIIYLKVKLNGMKYKEEIKHIVIDEAQDYSPIQLIAIKELTTCKFFTVVGDENQRFIKKEEKAAMMSLDTLFKDSEIKSFYLNKSYRSTKEIMEYANKFINNNNIIPLVRTGEKVHKEEFNDKSDFILSVKNMVDDMKEDNLESIAIICKNKNTMNKISKDMKEILDIKIIDNEDMIYNKGTVLIPSYFAKGLEFDGVIIIDDNDIISNDLTKYIMCTRALHRLSHYIIKF